LPRNDLHHVEVLLAVAHAEGRVVVHGVGDVTRDLRLERADREEREQQFSSALSVPTPAQTAPAQSARVIVIGRRRTAVPLRSTHTELFRLIASWRARFSTEPSSSAPAVSDDDCQYDSGLGTA